MTTHPRPGWPRRRQDGSLHLADELPTVYLTLKTLQQDQQTFQEAVKENKTLSNCYKKYFITDYELSVTGRPNKIIPTLLNSLGCSNQALLSLIITCRPTWLLSVLLDTTICLQTQHFGSKEN